jgi:hypothetical protein
MTIDQQHMMIDIDNGIMTFRDEKELESYFKS